jgi:proteic killer suppression protein
VDVVFGDRQLDRAYREHSRAVRAWGPDVAKKFLMRVEALYAATDFSEIRGMAALRAHPLKGERAGLWALDLTATWRLLVEPSDDGRAVTVREVSNHYE